MARYDQIYESADISYSTHGGAAGTGVCGGGELGAGPVDKHVCLQCKLSPAQDGIVKILPAR